MKVFGRIKDLFTRYFCKNLTESLSEKVTSRLLSPVISWFGYLSLENFPGGGGMWVGLGLGLGKRWK